MNFNGFTFVFHFDVSTLAANMYINCFGVGLIFKQNQPSFLAR